MANMLDLYQCLTLNHNFHNFVKIDEVMWKGWCDKLDHDWKLFDELMKRIDKGELQNLLDKSRQQCPTLQHIKILLTSVRRGVTLDQNTKNALGYDKPPNSGKEFIQEVTAQAIENAEKGAFDDFDHRLYTKYNHEYMDAYHNAKASGNYKPLQRFIINE